ncbi:class I SAM-dependent methyltransferase [Elizabethkingia anophelis]|uniref:class I SAM-dependent methyltransferase n=1 Tax=Elizabethkingia anophelis TaxID=1117645 RepID=UPI0005313B1B|nr:class I SAM-dependent methyltransferase [Elizabethkingia anophelis]KGT10289.1 SAM-dependent methyltransferase [Elizabethkingia anophelis]MDV3565927.1 class I SAM-dependent methyltransferase [Elizabethkingia anophelis]MDV3969562.1 class I SAM-dependent methyltransferase [Elizabethkingia anophelis]OPC38728.1 SAM-dependent methyltransferase [Elizabethkingia anophelis]QRI51368.1 methyltransferase domain-containing protein [Elizabethkingia anophelis]
MRTGSIEKMSGHWLLAKIGKKVLRPGGKDLTLKMLKLLAINKNDLVTEFAPGLGFTAGKIIEYQPEAYTGIDADEEAVELLKRKFSETKAVFQNDHAAQTRLNDNSQTKVLGEAMLTMQADHRKSEIVKEAYRILKPGGLYALHELALMPEALDESVKAHIQRELAEVIKVNTRPLTLGEWKKVLEKEGFSILNIETAPMHLLEPKRIISDEGFLGFLNIAKNMVLHPGIRERVLRMKNIFTKYNKNLCAVIIIARKD